jgi:hypothetical protein
MLMFGAHEREISDVVFEYRINVEHGKNRFINCPALTRKTDIFLKSPPAKTGRCAFHVLS